MMRSRFSLASLSLLTCLGGLVGCVGSSQGFNLSYIHADSNTYSRPSFIYERISHDSSGWPAIEYFRWLHGPQSLAPSPSEMATIQNPHLPESTAEPNPASPESTPQGNLPEARPQPGSRPRTEPPPQPRREESEAGRISPGPTAQHPHSRQVQPTSYRQGASLPGSRVLFARP